MRRTVLIPFDGSAIAEHAVPFAEVFAQRTGAQVLLLYATEERRRTADATPPTEAEATSSLDRVASRLRQGGIAVEIVRPHGDSVAAIAAEAARRPIDLIIIATRGRGVLGHGTGGSLADRLLEHLTLPVLLVRPWHTAETAARLTAQLRIIVPLDGSPLAETILPVAQWLVTIFGGELILLRVITPDPLWVHPNDPVHREAVAKGYLQRLAAMFVAAGFRVAVDVSIGDPARAIAAAVHRHNAALVVMATHGVTGLAPMPLGSVAKEIFWGGELPTVLVRPVAMLPPPLAGC